VQMSIDGYIAGPNGEMDWMVWDWDDKLKKYVFELTEPVDTIILGRKMTDSFVSYWSDIMMTKPDDPFYEFSKKLIEIPKVVFTKNTKDTLALFMNIGYIGGETTAKIASFSNSKSFASYPDINIIANKSLRITKLAGGYPDINLYSFNEPGKMEPCRYYMLFHQSL
jgi:RibD C-terminal domain